MISKGRILQSMMFQSRHGKARCATKIVCVALTVASTFIASSALAQLDYQLGDVDGDGCLGPGDVSIMLQLVQTLATDHTCFAAVDIVPDGVASLADLAALFDLIDDPPIPTFVRKT